MNVWYYSTDQSGETYNQCEDREDAIRSLDGRSGFIGVGHVPALTLSEHIDAESILEDLENNLYEIAGDDLLFDCTKEQVSDLTARLKKAADEWENANNLSFTQWTIEWADGPHEVAANPEVNHII